MTPREKETIHCALLHFYPKQYDPEVDEIEDMFLEPEDFCYIISVRSSISKELRYYDIYQDDLIKFNGF